MFTINQIVTVLLSASVASAATVSVRSTTSDTLSIRASNPILTDLSAVLTDTRNSSNQTDKYDGTAATFVPWVQATQGLLADIQKFGNDTKKAASVSSSDCNTAISVSNNINSTSQTFINKMINKKAVFTSEGVKPYVKNRLSDIQEALLLAYNQLCDKCNSQKCSDARLAIVGDYYPGINAYSN